ncbi:uncharacterized protein Dwil_GK27771 [Drosophila willistoni]|uniref:BPTI/Kunitz inhibitor domain-containing protein n=1 Tax=Drosophila willistoni TaxID=7260 RepID=A0A0Q9X150_DROWI|nr:hemolymph trypsin inhibitor B [Drosophila willistoni]KRF98459.1 uncharacterized protein Dwil_GK27771 [Drosophila willistoni]
MKFVAIFCLLGALFGLNYADQDPVCGLPPGESGKCKAFTIKFTYYASIHSCKKFLYGGCGGNANRFDTQKQCVAKCKK